VNQGSRYGRIAFPRNTSSPAIPASEMLNSPSATRSSSAPPSTRRSSMALFQWSSGTPCAVGAVQELGDRGQTG
jgi:hypothetical protein